MDWKLFGLGLFVLAAFSGFFYFLYRKFKPTEFIGAYTATVVAIATALLTYLTHQQATINYRMLQEMKAAREQQFQPYVHVWFEPGLNRQYVMIARCMGGGIARDLSISYELGGKPIMQTYKVLGPGEEISNLTGLTLDDAIKLGSFKVHVAYKDMFGREFKESFDETLRQRTAPRSRYSEWKESIERNQQQEADQARMVERLTQAIEKLDRKAE